jgi:uncharacterized protein (DUF983 family)
MSERLQAILAQKCPVCFEGTVFSSRIAMNESCPVCETHFEREQGYWMGALYVAHALAMPVLSALTLLCWLLGLGSVGLCFFLAIAIFLPAGPAVSRYSRVIWMHLDQLIDPRPESSRT